jgi:putative membrane protein
MFYMHNSAGWGWGWWVLMTIGMIAFWALLVYAVVWLVRGRPAAEREQASPPEAPDQILKRRLAQGEISIEEYERLHAAIHPRPGGPISDGERRRSVA